MKHYQGEQVCYIVGQTIQNQGLGLDPSQIEPACPNSRLIHCERIGFKITKSNRDREIQNRRRRSTRTKR
jgi:hypothetical protein